ncbi:MAG TPA: peptidase [bacterium]|nr:peptidase [bacterium]
MNTRHFRALPAFCFFWLACSSPVITEKAPMKEVRSELDKLVPVILTHDISHLPPGETETLRLLVNASRYADEIFVRQVCEENPALLERLEKLKGPERVYLDFFKVMYGPWNRLVEDTPMIGSRPKPPGAGYYPPDMTREEFLGWIQDHPADAADFESNFTVIRRTDQGLTAVPYSAYYHDLLEPMAALLREAADRTPDPSLRTYLNSRAEAFFSDDYYQSDMDWMDLSGDIEVVIGPYEVYEDNLFGYKAAFESFVCVVDHGESEKQRKIANYLDALERALPIADEHKNFDRGAESPTKVVHLLFSAGDTRAGVQTTAFNLPNDERVREAKGSKKVMLKNVMHAKYDNCWIPIVNRILSEKDLARVSFDAYFNHVLMHEFSHGLGPGTIRVNGIETTVNRELKELYATIEEAKADVLGVFTAQLLIDWGVFPKALEETLYASNLGGMFRSIRFGVDAAHGGGVAIQLNYYLDEGACRVDETGRFTVDDARMKTAVRKLAARLLEIQAAGDYPAARALIEQYRVIRPEVREALDRLEDVPIDIRPVYPFGDE